MTDYKFKYLKYKKKYLDLKTGGSIYYNNDEPILITNSSEEKIIFKKRYIFNDIKIFHLFCKHNISIRKNFYLYPVKDNFSNSYKREDMTEVLYEKTFFGAKKLLSFKINDKQDITPNNFGNMCVVFYDT